jgi:hypothetical protein
VSETVCEFGEPVDSDSAELRNEVSETEFERDESDCSVDSETDELRNDVFKTEFEFDE